MYCMEIAEGMAKELATNPQGDLDEDANVLTLDMCRNIFNAAVARAISPEEGVQFWMGLYNKLMDSKMIGSAIVNAYHKNGDDEIALLENLLWDVKVIPTPGMDFPITGAAFEGPPVGDLPDDLPPEVKALLEKAGRGVQVLTRDQFEDLMKKIGNDPRFKVVSHKIGAPNGAAGDNTGD